MRKTFFALSVAAALASPVSAFAADMTAQQKYDALAAKGIFSGIGGEQALDQNMNRAQFARVAALIIGLEGIGSPDTRTVTQSPFSDVPLTHWAVEEIAAAKEAGLLTGNSDGTFNPAGPTSQEQLAVVVVRALGLSPMEGAKVEGASEWAAGYVAAAVAAGLIPRQDDYSAPATRGQLVAISYEASPSFHVPSQAEIAAQVISDAVKANPDQAASIVSDAIKTDPSQADLIVKAAIQAAPDKAADITRAALAAAEPEQRDAIVQAAIEAAPLQAEAIQDAAAEAAQANDGVVASNPTMVQDTSSIPNSNSSGGGGNGDETASPSSPNSGI